MSITDNRRRYWLRWAALITGLIGATAGTAAWFWWALERFWQVSLDPGEWLFMVLVLVRWGVVAAAWKWPLICGVLLILDSLFIATLVVEYWQAYLFETLLSVCLLLMVSGILFILSWREGRKRLERSIGVDFPQVVQWHRGNTKETTNDWYEGIAEQISSLKDNLTKKDYQIYELDYLKRVARKVANLSPECNECRNIQDTITEMVTTLADSPQMGAEKKEDYFRMFRSAAKHLEGHVTALWKWSPIMVILVTLGSLTLVAGITMVSIAGSFDNGAASFLTGILFGALAIALIVIGIILLSIPSIKFLINFLRSMKRN